MKVSLLVILFAINYLQICWFIGYKKYFNLRQTIFLTGYLFFQLLVNYFINDELSFLLYVPFLILEFFFIVHFLKNWTLAVFYSLIQNTLLILSWFFTWEPVYILWVNTVITSNLLNFIKPIAIVLQQLLLFILILITKKILVTYRVFQSISQLQKKYIVQSISCFILLLFLNTLRQLILQGNLIIFRIEQYIYLTFILLALTGIFCYIVYMISHFYQQQHQVSLLSKELIQESDKIVLANEFKHDYRNILLSLSTYLDQKQFDEARDYLSSIIEYSNSFIDTDYYAYISLIDIPPVQGILLNFAEHCLKHKIQCQFFIHQPISYADITINLLDFIRCLSILLDNAIEASLATPDPLIKVTIEKYDSSLFVEIKNATNKTISIENILKNNFTTKKGHQGKGLPILIKLLKQYRETTYSFTQKNNFFIVRFSLPKKEDP